MQPGDARSDWTIPSQRVVKNIKTAHAQTWQARRDRTCPRALRGDPHLTARLTLISPVSHFQYHDCAFASSAPLPPFTVYTCSALLACARCLSLPPSCLRRRLAIKLRPATTTRPPPTPPRPLRAHHHHSCRHTCSMRTDIQ
ncbi:hypothetical protein GMOD_00006175 [Pyrenophora seminiperda CCB06]|uniref:Uncharacterized protein n=1 Tax=Pyrenophora seminiperda CCB06 TaxID=1302712 RepID=A0A3M7M4H3_9PLEO|nr:hypothetical protein GMOD_00006175 [Pyrenophora seminiperda CCB06]